MYQCFFFNNFFWCFFACCGEGEGDGMVDVDGGGDESYAFSVFVFGRGKLSVCFLRFLSSFSCGLAEN